VEKRICCACKRDIGLFTGKTALKDGFVCNKCLKDSEIPSFPNGRHLPSNYIERIIKARTHAIKNFSATHSYDRIDIDINTRSFKTDGILFLFDNLLDYTYHEDPVNPQNQNIKNNGAAIGGIVGGLRGGLVGGAVGVAVGSAVGSLLSSTCNSMDIKITFQDFPMSSLTLQFITEKTKTSSPNYKKALNQAKSCLEGLRHIVELKSSPSPKNNDGAPAHNSVESKNVFIQDKHFTAKELAEELDIYKALLYNGEITQEEYDQKKKYLLSLK